ncbi:TadE/TadG family type IV pilus assembly protein [Nakamurella sp. A5-74]|uniref:TadE/TadG family type IV pilus assembly protein n=1 Tax=Nakamurella sp. A5-74 TaxID=3158264 RepID=A0AAU8DTL3_9ACTN
MAEFAMVIVLLMILFLSLVSVGLWMYTRTVATAAAADAARYVANADIPPASAAAKVRELLGDGIVGSTGEQLSCTAVADGDLVGVTCTLPAPGIVSLLDGVLPTITVTGHSVRER